MPDPPKDTKNRPLTKEEWAALRNEQNYAAIFRSMRPNWTVKIDRTRPTWCIGWCETVDFDPDEPIDLEYIRTNWGGQRFKCEIHDELGQYVTVFRISIDAAPRRFGKLAEHPDDIERRKKREDLEREMSIRPQNAAPAPAIDPTIGQILADSIKTVGSSKDSQLAFVTDLLKDKFDAEPEGRRDMKELMELATSMKEFAELLGMTPGEGGGDDFWGVNATKLLDILDRKSESDRRRSEKSRPDESFKQKGQRQIRVVKNLGNADPGRGAVRPPVPVAAADLSRTQLAATLSSMSPIDAATVFMSTLSKMSPDDREELTSILMGGQEFEDDDDQGEDVVDDQGEDVVDDQGEELDDFHKEVS